MILERPLRRPVATWVAFAAFVVLGLYALPKLRIESMPEVELPSVTIQTTWLGASPEAVQRSVSVPIEEAVRRVHGVEEVISRSRPGESIVTVSFRRDVDPEFARLEVAEQVGAIARSLPPGAEHPNITAHVPEEFSVGEFFTFSLISPLQPDSLREEAERWVLPKVLAVDGVAHAEIQGGARRILKVVLDRERLRAFGIRDTEVFSRIQALDDIEAGGCARVGPLEAFVTIRDSVTVSALERVPVARRQGRLIRLVDLAEVRWDHEDPTWLVRVNGKNQVRVVVDKRRGANAISVARRLRQRLPAIEAQAPFPLECEVEDDLGRKLEERIIDLVERSVAILLLLFLLLLVSIGSLRLSATVIGSILLAVLLSMSLFYFTGVSVNFITISGLALCFGMILDNSILVLDSVHRRLGEAGGPAGAPAPIPAGPDPAEPAAGAARRASRRIRLVAEGASEVAFPIAATTLTTIVAFLSFLFLSGRLALYYVPLAVAVAAAMGASIVVALLWMPVALDTLWVRRKHLATPGGAKQEGPHRRARAGERFEAFVRWTLRHWWLVVLLAAASLAGGGYVYAKKVNKGGFWKMPEREKLTMWLRMPEGTDIVMTYETLKRFERELLPVPEGIRVQSTVMRNWGRITVDFDDEMIVSEYPFLYRARLINLAEKMAGIGVYVIGFAEESYFKGLMHGFGLNSIIEISGYNSVVLDRLAEQMASIARRSRRAQQVMVLNDLRYAYAPQEETVIRIRRDRLGEYGLSVGDVVRHLSRLLDIDWPRSMFIEGEVVRVVFSFSDAEDIEFEDIAGKSIRTPEGKWVRLGDVLELERLPIEGTITRRNQRYSKFVTWEFVGTERMRLSFISKVLEKVPMPYGFTAEEYERRLMTRGESREMLLAALLAVGFIYMVLAGLFESLSLPFLVLLSVPMALVGVFLAFWLTDSSFDSSAHAGLVLLFGIVVNNAILLVSRFRREGRAVLEARGEGGVKPWQGCLMLDRLPRSERVAALVQAVARGTRVRLRSILLTSGTTMAGLAPLLFRRGHLEGKDIWQNLALSSVGGLASSVILVLLCVPAAYYVSVRLGWFLRERILRRRRV